MLRAKTLVSLLLAASLVALVVAGCESDLEPFQPPTPGEADFYVGSATCARCHPGTHAAFSTTGHPHILQPVLDDQRPDYPFRGDVTDPLRDPPPGHGWGDLGYVIGGFAWMARFLDQGGYLLTGPEAQWNLATGVWAPYAEGETQKPYDCGPCHTTGYDPEGAREGQPGIVGDWAEAGVGCEACHGPGGKHVAAGGGVDMTVDRGSALCGQCHARTPDPQLIPAWPPAEDRGQFIRHENQYTELRNGPHRYLTCVTCHDPHRSAVFEPEQAITRSCETCHGDVEIFITGGGAHTCEHCHMPPAVMAATQVYPHQADVQSHLFRINADPAAGMFYEQDGQWYAHDYLTLDFTCLRCHVGRDLDWAAQWAPNVHSMGDDKVAGEGVIGGATP